MLQIFAADRQAIIIKLGSRRAVIMLQRIQQILHQGIIIVVGRAYSMDQKILLLVHLVQTAVDAPEPGIAGAFAVLQGLQQHRSITSFPTEIRQHCQLGFHTAQKLADGVKIAGLVVQTIQNHLGLIMIDVQLHQQCCEECAQKEDDTPLEGHVMLEKFHAGRSFLSNFPNFIVQP